MLTRRFLGTAVAALAFVAASGTARAAERSMMGIVLGRSYRQVLNRFGTPDRVQVVQIPVPGQGNAGMPDQSAMGGAPGYGGPGGAPGYGGPGGPGGPYGGPPGGSGGPAGGSSGPPGMPGGGASYGPPGGSGGPPGGGGSSGPPVLPPAGGGPGMPGAPGAGDFPVGTQVQGVGNGAEWIYNRPGGTTLAFIINEDGRVAQISVSSGKTFPAARTARGVTLGMDYKHVLNVYGWPPTQLIGPYYTEAYYTKSHHAAFSFVKGKLVRITIALAD